MALTAAKSTLASHGTLAPSEQPSFGPVEGHIHRLKPIKLLQSRLPIANTH